MPRPSRTSGAKHWYGFPLKLEETQKTRLCEDLLGLDLEEPTDKQKADFIIAYVEICLGSYFDKNGLKKHYDEAPTNAAYRDETTVFISKADNLLQELANTSYRMQGLYEFKPHERNNTSTNKP